MYHLGIHYSHNATVAVVKDGRLIFCQSEERLNRIKNSTGFPEKTLEYVYHNICGPEEIASATLQQSPIGGYLALKSKGFQPFESGYYLSPETENRRWFQESAFRWRLGDIKTKYITARSSSLYKEAHKFFSNSLNISPDKVAYMDHHLAHSYSVVPNLSDWDQGLVFTLDGVGDWKCATVSKYSNGKIENLCEVDHFHSLGYYYNAITALLGMKAGAHEFKVMGLAPYANRKYYVPILEKFRGLLRVNDEGGFSSSIPPSGLKFALGKIILNQRFDNVAGAIQEFTEELITKWVHYWISKTNIAKIAVSGGVFMNVKACQKLNESCRVEKLFVMPSAADETTAVGAAFWGAKQMQPEIELQPIDNLYLGMEFSDAEIDKSFEELEVSSRYELSKPENLNREVAALLAADEVVARCSGRMEFGARALGNRSILANASNFENIELINAAIKNRDFWMPFTPSILFEDMNRYIVGADQMSAPYMCITFDTTEEAKRDLRAAVHPRDKTARPQSVIRDWNPDYYEIISEYKAMTGIGGILNTSFNLHGEPNVCSPRDALHTMDSSGLKYLCIGPYLINKKTSS